jgi:metallo-beta-lactamase family protein
MRVNGLIVMVDCGSAQGGDYAAPMEEWPIKPTEVDFLFLTHAHIDHIGRVPELIRKGFRGEILTTEPTKYLLKPMLEDAMGFSRFSEREVREIAGKIDGLSWDFEYGKLFELKNGVRFKLGRTGHILGSCFIRLEEEGKGWSVVFSGDLGATGAPLLPDPDIPEPCDLLVMESTYGDTVHEAREQRGERLGRILERALRDGGKVFIPAFALGRTQELIYEMDRLFAQGEMKKRKVPVFLDSPLGLEVTKITARLREFWDREAKELLGRGDDPLDFERLYGIGDHRAHRGLLEMEGPAVIIAGSGMCTGGRIVDHLRSGIEDGRNDVLFVGYQAKGTPGRDLVECGRRGGGSVWIGGERLPVKARVHELGGYSAHADQRELVEWAEAIRPGRVKLVHGEAGAREALREKMYGTNRKDAKDAKGAQRAS